MTLRIRLLGLALLAAALPAQVAVVCAPSPVEYSKAIFDRRTAKQIQHWSCVATNHGATPITVAEAALQGWMMRQGISALSSEAIRIGAPEVKRRGRWATAGRVVGYLALAGTAAAAGDWFAVNSTWGTGLGLVALNLPRVGEALTGRDPSDALFERLALDDGIALDAGRSVSVSMFAAPRKDASPVDGMLDIGGTPVVSLPSYKAIDGAGLWEEAVARWAGGKS